MSNELERVADFRAIIREFTEYAKPTGNPDSDMTPDDWEVGLATFLARASRPAPQVVTTMDELEALPVMSVFTDVDGEAWQVYEDRHGRRIRCNAGSGISWQEAYFPATVLYPHLTPDVDVLAEVRALARRMRHEAGCAFVQSRIGNGLGHIECDCNKGALTAILDREAGR